MKKAFRILFILAVIAGLGYAGVKYGNVAITTVNQFADSPYNEMQTYRKHHRPVEGSYYEIVATSTTDGKVFIIAQNVKMKITSNKAGDSIVETEKHGSIREVEVPANKVGALNGSYFTVRVVDGKLATIYFVSEHELLRHALNVNTSST